MAIEHALDDEILALVADIAAKPDPRVLRLRALKAARALYPDGGSHSRQAQDMSEGAVGYRPRTVVRKPDPSREPLFEAVDRLLAGATTPTKTSAIFTTLEMLDIPIGGKVPMSNLSAILHNSKRYKSYGRQGWMLPENAKAYDAIPSLDRSLLEGVGNV